MRIAEIVTNVIIKLAALPGLRFLQGYALEAKVMKTGFGQRKGDYQAYLMNVRGAMDDIKGAKGAPRRGSSEEDRDDEPHAAGDDDYDWYDDLESRAAPRGGGGHSGPADDYPGSDDNVSYFDDDYRH